MTTQVERSKFVTELLNEIDLFDESLFPPNKKIKDGETVIGEAPPWLRKMFSMLRFLKREFNHQRIDTEDDLDPASPGNKLLIEMHFKYDLLTELFYCSLRAELNLFGEGTIGMRDGWKVVRAKSEPHEKIKEALDRLFGE